VDVLYERPKPQSERPKTLAGHIRKKRMENGLTQKALGKQIVHSFTRIPSIADRPYWSIATGKDRLVLFVKSSSVLRLLTLT